MTEDIKKLDKQYYMNTFGDRLDVCFEKGAGMKLYSMEGGEYYDFLGGIAVNALGHSHPKFIAALKEQLDKLIHTSSLYYIENQAKLAKAIADKSCADRVFFANSGAEANEGAFKLAKIYFYKKGMPEKSEIITLDNSFHGRTLATVAATGQAKYQKPYKPLAPGFIQVAPNDFGALEGAVSDKTAAVMIELVQGESGVRPMDSEYVKKVRRLCDEEGIILIVDEVQTGMGRSGKLFCYETYGIEPDIFTLAKALGGGVPIGAVCAKEFVASAFEPGDHGSTFGGNAFATAAGLAVLKIFDEEHILDNVNLMSEYFMHSLNELMHKYPEYITELRNTGLLIGIELEEDKAREVFNKMFEKHFLTSLCHSTMRLAPPLIIKKEDIDAFTGALDDTLKEIRGGK